MITMGCSCGGIEVDALTGEQEEQKYVQDEDGKFG